MELFLKEKENNSDWNLSAYEEKIKSSCKCYQHFFADIYEEIGDFALRDVKELNNIILPFNSIKDIKYLISDYNFLNLDETRLFNQVLRKIHNQSEDEDKYQKIQTVLNTIVSEMKTISNGISNNLVFIDVLSENIETNVDIKKAMKKYIDSQIRLMELLLKCITNKPYFDVLLKDKDEYIDDLLSCLVKGRVKISNIEKLQKILRIPIISCLKVYTNAENYNIETFKYGLEKLLKIDNKLERKKLSKRKLSSRRKSKQRTSKSEEYDNPSIVEILSIPINGASQTSIDSTIFLKCLLKYITKKDLKKALKSSTIEHLLADNLEQLIVYDNLIHGHIKLATFLLRDLKLDISESLFGGLIVDLTLVDNPSCIKLILEYFKKHIHFTEFTWECIKELKVKLSESGE